MAQTLRLKRSSVPGRVPTTATLQTGEIAINTADGLVYIRKDDDSIIPLLGANTVVTGSITLLGSVTATSFTGSFSGSAEDLRGVVLDYSASAGDGMLAFTYNGSADALISLDTGSDHFVNAVVNLIDTNAPSIIAQDTTGPSGIDISYNSDTGALSASLLYPEIQLGLTTIQLGNSAASVTNFDLENTKSTGSFSGSFTGIATEAISASHAVNSDLAATASYAIVTTTASYAETSTSASHALISDLSVTASYSLVATSASYASTSTSASHAVNSDIATTASYALVATTASYAETSTSASHAINADIATTASYAIVTTTASYAETSTSASHAINADIAISASHALLADNALTASYVLNAVSASYAEFTVLAQDAISASYAATASSANDFLVRGDLDVQGIVTAREFHTEFVSASIVFSSGSTKFGDTADDVHEFTGSALFSGSIDADDITINDWGSVSASLAQLDVNNSSLTLQDVTDNGAETTLAITASNLNITGYPDVSASLAAIQSANNLQGVTDNGNTTTNQIIINNELTVSSSIYSKGEEVLDFAVAMAIALG